MNNLKFNSQPPTWIHIDLNSCFASIEQQANPLLRGKPIAVAAYTTPRGCILAPSVEAKRYGVKTGMRVIEGKQLCPELIILPSDPPKYRFINRALLKLFNEYSPSVFIRSIDEMLLNFDYLVTANNSMIKTSRQWTNASNGDIKQKTPNHPLLTIAREIKTRIKTEIGDWLTVSIGISTNPYLAKLAAGLHKPDGLDEINQHNILNILSSLQLVDLPYIKDRNALRLNLVGIKTPIDFYFASPQRLKAAFQSIQGHYWYLRLHGFVVDAVEWERRSVGHSYALPKFTNDRKVLHRLLCKLVEKMGARLRKNNWTAQGVHVACEYIDSSFWHKGHKFPQPMYASSDLLACAEKILDTAPLTRPVRVLAVSCFALTEDLYGQLTLFRDELKKRALTQAVDQINERWGEFFVVPATMINMQDEVLDRISFGSVRDMPQNYVAERTGWERELYLET